MNKWWCPKYNLPTEVWEKIHVNLSNTTAEMNALLDRLTFSANGDKVIIKYFLYGYMIIIVKSMKNLILGLIISNIWCDQCHAAVTNYNRSSKFSWELIGNGSITLILNTPSEEFLYKAHKDFFEDTVTP